jgi:hypothetical protein
MLTITSYIQRGRLILRRSYHSIGSEILRPSVHIGSMMLLSLPNMTETEPSVRNDLNSVYSLGRGRAVW